MLFANRAVAGRLLAHRLIRYANRTDVVVLALARGGVPVGFEIADELDAPLDVLVVRKIGLPGNEEVAIGAIAPGDVLVLNHELLVRLRMPQSLVEFLAARERDELARREQIYHSSQPDVAVEGRIAIIVDDGLATGASMIAAIRTVRLRRPRLVIVAVPVAASDKIPVVSRFADDVVYVATPEPFNAVSTWYDHFDQTTDREVCNYLRMAAERLVEQIAN